MNHTLLYQTHNNLQYIHNLFKSETSFESNIISIKHIEYNLLKHIN